jgi:streptogramin lyase
MESTAISGPEPGALLQGKVIGGQQPVVGAHVYLLAAAETGYGTKSTSLLKVAQTGLSDATGAYVLTDANGNFTMNSVTNGTVKYFYTCPTADTQVYMYAKSGDPGVVGINTHIGLMTALGSCGNLSDNTSVEINEVTTIATAYALAGFAVDVTHIATSATALGHTGLVNAFLNVPQMVDTETGVALATTPNGNGTVDQAQIYTLADIIAACVNSSGATTGPTNPSACYTLLYGARANGSTGSVPTSTATAAINIAHNPANNVATLYALASATPPFPAEATQPNDFTVGISYSGGGITGPGQAADGIAIGPDGSVWIGNYAANSISKLSSTGVPAEGSPFTPATLSGPGGIALDMNGVLWIANSGGNNLIKLANDGMSSTPVTGGIAITARNVVIDANGNAWADNSASGEGLTKINNAGTTATTYKTGVDQSTPINGLAIDHTKNIWAGQGNTVIELASTGVANANSPYNLTNGSQEALGVAIDATGSVWVAPVIGDRTGQPDLVKIVNSGSSVAQTEYTGNGLNSASGVALDGAGNVWVANSNLFSTSAGSGVSEFSNAGAGLSPTTFKGGGVNAPSSIAVDGSGNVWAVNSFTGTANPPAGTVTELIGAGVPVVTPIVQGLQTGFTPGSQP